MTYTRASIMTSWNENGVHIIGPLWESPSVTDEFPHKGPELRYFLIVNLNKLLNKQYNDRWFKTLWRLYDVIVMVYVNQFPILLWRSTSSAQVSWCDRKIVHTEQGNWCDRKIVHTAIRWLGDHWFRKWLAAWQRQVITISNANLWWIEPLWTNFQRWNMKQMPNRLFQENLFENIVWKFLLFCSC